MQTTGRRFSLKCRLRTIKMLTGFKCRLRPHYLKVVLQPFAAVQHGRGFCQYMRGKNSFYYVLTASKFQGEGDCVTLRYLYLYNVTIGNRQKALIRIPFPVNHITKCLFFRLKKKYKFLTVTILFLRMKQIQDGIFAEEITRPPLRDPKSYF